jgi:[ribosomal protein S18]-alanine N-acetyltransferase
MITVRRGEASDLSIAAQVQALCPEASQWDPSTYLSYDFRVAELEGRLAGFLVARRLVEDEAEILNLAVAPQYRRRGVARALLADLCRNFAGVVHLEVRASNSGAQGLYKAIGFKEVSIRKDYYEEPPEAAVVMNLHSC